MLAFSLEVLRRTLTSRRVDSTLHLRIREELDARHWTHGQLAERLGVRSGVVSRWLSDDPTKRVVPLPQVCVQIADAFGWNAVDVFRTAGYLPPMENTPPPGPHEQEIQQAMRSVQRALTSVPEHEWPLAYQVARAYLDALPLILHRLDGQSDKH